MPEFNTLDDFDVAGKTVLLRVDFNLPLDKETLEILDTTRIQRALPTIRELVEKNAKVVILTHQGRPGTWDFTSMENHAAVLSELLDQNVMFVDDVCGDRAQQAIAALKQGDVLFLDNVRKFSGERDAKSPEEHAESALVKQLASLADLFVNDAFAAAHRSHCSLVGFTAVLPSCAGRLMENELKTLGKIVTNPQSPAVFLFGGAKYSDVVKTIERTLQNGVADKILLAGLPAHVFLRATGMTLGETNEKALEEEKHPDLVDDMQSLLDRFESSIVLPVDFAVKKDDSRAVVSREDLPVDYPLFDIGPDTIRLFCEQLKDAATIFLSGPCGVFEEADFMQGTQEVFSAAAQSDAFSIVGGGHTVAAVEKLGLRDRIGHVSTGGGSLERFMMGESLPVVEALKQAKNKHLQ